MPVTLFAQNVLESAAWITVQPPANSDKPLARLYDRDKGPQYQGGAQSAWGMPVAFTLPLAMSKPTQTVIRADLGSLKPLSGWALVNTGIAVVMTLKADATNPPTTTRDTVNPAGADFLRTFASADVRYVEITIATTAPLAGELLLGVPRVISENPFTEQAGARRVNNVARDRARSGYLRSTKKGPKRTRLPWGWIGLGQADVDVLQAALDDCGDGAKKLLVRDELGVLRWMDCLTDELDPQPRTGGLYDVALMLEESA